MTRSTVTGELLVPVLYLDLDGTVRHGFDELGRWVNGPSDVVIFDGVTDLLWTYKKLGWRVVAVSNQGGVALGRVPLKKVASAMLRTQRSTSNAFDRMAFCVHHPGAENPEMAVCWCRKPRPGLVIEAALELAAAHRGEIYPPHLALFVGDRPEDEGCAANAGIRFMAAAQWRAGKHLDELRRAAA